MRFYDIETGRPIWVKREYGYILIFTSHIQGGDIVLQQLPDGSFQDGNIRFAVPEDYIKVRPKTAEDKFLQGVLLIDFPIMIVLAVMIFLVLLSKFWGFV